MKGIDIHNYAQRTESIKNRIKNSKRSEHNKQLIFEFVRDCLTGWGAPLNYVSGFSKYSFRKFLAYS